MAFLERFLVTERELLVSLPYRAGLWVSRSDTAGGREAGGRELEALAGIIEAKAKGMFESAFVHEIMIEICTRKNDWPLWQAVDSDISADCAEAMTIITKKLSPRDAAAYRQNLMHIAMNVARIFREFDVRESLPVRLKTYVRVWLDKMIGITRGEVYESENLLSISMAEDMALAKLSDSLAQAAPADPMTNVAMTGK